MTMRYAHLSPAHLGEAVDKARLVQNNFETVTAIVTKLSEPVTIKNEGTAEALEELRGIGGGAGRVRTAASQFCSNV